MRQAPSSSVSGASDLSGGEEGRPYPLHPDRQQSSAAAPWPAMYAEMPATNADFFGDARRQRRAQTTSVTYIEAIVKNTFLDVVDPDEAPPEGLTRSASDSDISRSSEDRLLFWLPQISSSSEPSGPIAGEESFDIHGNVYVSEPSLPSPAARPQPNPSNMPAQHGPDGDPETPEAADGIDAEEIPLLVRQMQEETGLPLAELMASHKSHDLSLVPRHATTGVLLSLGSRGHREGDCNPCMFHATRSCLKGVTCLFCHRRHRDYRPRRVRPPKKKRDKMKKAAGQAELQTCAESSSDDEDAPSSSQNPPPWPPEAPVQGRQTEQPMSSTPHSKLRL